MPKLVAYILEEHCSQKTLTAGSKVTECASVHLSSDYADIVALTETWLTDEDTTSVSKLLQRKLHAHSPAAWRRSTRWSYWNSVPQNSPARIPCHCQHLRLRNTLRHSMKRPHQLHNACSRDVPATCFGTFLDDVSKVLLIAGTHPSETVVCGDVNMKYGDPT